MAGESLPAGSFSAVIGPSSGRAAADVGEAGVRAGAVLALARAADGTRRRAAGDRAWLADLAAPRAAPTISMECFVFFATSALSRPDPVLSV